MNDSIRQLESRRDELRNRLIAIQKDLGRGLEKDYEEQAVQLENMEVLQEIARVAEEDLREVELQLSSLRSAESGKG
jgi:hypothetical protein